MEEGCTLEGCDNPLRDGIRITQKNRYIGGICLDCLGSAKAAKLLMRKKEDDYFELEEMQRIENPL